MIAKIMGYFKTPWSLANVAKDEITSWRSSNKALRDFVYSRLESELLFMGEHPVRNMLSLVVLYLSWYCLIFWKIPQDWFFSAWGSWREDEHFSYFSIIWAVQVTLAALVYPIVISLVTLFLQRRPLAEAFVQLYLVDSGALAAGLSSLALVAVMGVQYLLIPTYDTKVLPALVSLDTAWLLLNVILSTYFIFRTIEFLRPEVQELVVQRYVTNIALPRKVEALLAYQILAISQSKDWIPSINYLENPAPEGPRVLLSKYAFRDGAAQGTIQRSRPSRLINVRLWLLRFAVTGWVKAAERWPKPVNSNFRNKGDWPLLTVLMTPGAVYRDSFPLAQVTDGPNLTYSQKLALRYSFVFAPIKAEAIGIEIESILKELEADVRAAAGRMDFEGFRRAQSSLIELHELLLRSTSTKNPDGTQGSWALLPDSNNFAGRALHIQWAETYRSIFSAAIQVMTNDSRPSQFLCHITQQFDRNVLQTAPEEIREHLLGLPPILMYQLGKWWIQRVEEQGIIHHAHDQMVELRPPLNRVYEEVVSDLISGWESARSSIGGIPESIALEWPISSAIGRVNAAHVTHTARMLLAAVSRGDRIAAEWFADALAKWWGELDYENQPIALYGKTQYLTLEHLKLEWPIVSEELGLSEEDIKWGGDGINALQRGVLVAALKNYWTDIRVIVLEILLEYILQGADDSLDDSLALVILRGFLTGQEWRSGGQQSDPLSALTAANYLEIKIRQYAASGKWVNGYTGILNQFVERIKGMERPGMVGSRVYTFSGADDLESLQREQLLLMCILSNSNWEASESLRNKVDIWISKNYGSVKLIGDRVNAWLSQLSEKPFKDQPIVEALLKKLNVGRTSSAAEQAAITALKSFKEWLETRRANLFANTPVDPARLEQIARSASKKGFSSDSGVFPMQLFSNIEASSQTLKDFTLNVNQVRKGELTAIEIEQRASNEDEYWAETLSRHVASIVLADVLRSANCSELNTTNAEQYWHSLKAGAAKIVAEGGMPILILDNATRPSWVWQWQHADYGKQYTRPDDLNVQRIKDRGPGYVCNFNNIEVYVGSLISGQSYLLPKAAFNKVEFQDYGNGKFVDVTYSERPDSNALVDLRIKFSRKVESVDFECLKLIYGSETKE